MEENRGFSARLQYLQCVSNGDTAVLYKAIEINNIINDIIFLVLVITYIVMQIFLFFPP